MPGFVPGLEKQGLIPSKLLAEHDFFNDWFPEGKDSEGKSFPLQLEHLVQILILMLCGFGQGMRPPLVSSFAK